MLKLFDTLENRPVEFHQRKKGEVAIYVCGPTVYDVPHLGHARTAITYDVIVRYLEWLGNKVSLVVNITDVDDKIITCANRENKTESEIAEKYLGVYLDLMMKLNIRPPDHQPRATEYIPQMVEIISELIDKGMAYEIEGSGVYFDVEAFGEYGKLVHRSADDLLESGQGRIEPVAGKKNQLDFALWKSAKEGEPTWDSPWMPGRPGWHIECVAMSLGELGDNFDIHGGGSDLIFPHHENERAEALAIGRNFARHWVHSGMVNVDGEKMAKSEGNFVTMDEQLKNTNPTAFRLAVLQTHYRSAMEITHDSLTAAKAGAERIADFLRRCAAKELVPDKALPKADEEAFVAAMDNDFATPVALGVLFDAVSHGNVALEKDDIESAVGCLASVREFVEVLGLDFKASSASGSGDGDFSPEICQLIDEREKARIGGDFEKSDELRDKLNASGITIRDTSEGPLYFQE